MTEARERVAIFLDWQNLEGAFREMGGQPDILALRDYLAAGRDLMETFVFAGIHPNHVEGNTRFQAFLRREGFLVRTKPAKLVGNGQVRCNLDVEMALDAMEFAREVKPDIVVLGTGDGDFTPLAERLRLMGIRLEVAATPATISGVLLEAASGFIDLERAVRETSQEDTQEEGGEHNGDGHH